MDNKVINLSENMQAIYTLADNKRNKGDLDGALSLFMYAEKVSPSYKNLSEIAKVYSEMELYDLSNQYWFYYLDKAPVAKRGIAYESIAVNYYYLDNILSAGIFFGLKLSVDGHIVSDNLDPEMIEFFSGNENKKKYYKVVHPVENVDFSSEVKDGKRAFFANDYLSAIKIFSSVPKGCKDYAETLNELSATLFVIGDTEGALAKAKESVKVSPGVSSYCNIATLYNSEGNKEKSNYYYKRALEFLPQSVEDKYKFSICAVEKNQPEKAIQYIEELLLDRKFDINLHYIYGIALLQLNRYDEGAEQLNYAYRLNPLDRVIKYYSELANKLVLEDFNAKKIDLRNFGLLPESEEKARINFINKLCNEKISKIDSCIKNVKFEDTFMWALCDAENQTFISALMVLANSNTPKADSYLTDALMCLRVGNGVKRSILNTLILKGYKEKINVATSTGFFTIKPKKMPCEKDGQANIFFLGYAYALSTMPFFAVKDLDKLAFSTNELYKKHNEELSNLKLDREQMAILIIYNSKFKQWADIDALCSVFGASVDKIKDIIKVLGKGNENDT